MKGSLFSTSGSGSAFETANQTPNLTEQRRLHNLVCELAKLVDVQRSRLELLDEEANHFR